MTKRFTSLLLLALIPCWAGAQEDPAKAVEAKIGEATEKATATVEAAQEKVEAVGEAAKEKTTELLDSAKEKAGEAKTAKTKAVEIPAEAKEKAAEVIEGAKEKVADTVKPKPVAPDPAKPDPVKPDPAKPAPVKPAPAKPAPAPEKTEEVQKDPAAPFDSLAQKVSYAIGMQMAAGLEKQGIPIDAQVLADGLRDHFAKNTKIDSSDASEALFAYQKERIEKRKERLEQIGAENKAKGAEHLAKNKAKEGVITTESGLQYEVLTQGEGKKPNSTDRVKVHYHGTLIDGSVFDSSVDRDAPSTFGVSNVIAGWTEGLQLMSVGSKYRFTIPSELAYAERGTPARRPNEDPKIGPNAVLTFDVELLSIENAAPVIRPTP